MPISCRVISLCSFFFDSSVTFDITSHLLLHKKLPPSGLCDTSLLFLHLAETLEISADGSSVSPPSLLVPLKALSSFPFLSCQSLPECFGQLSGTHLLLSHDLNLPFLFVQSGFCGILCCTTYGFPRCCMYKDEGAALSMAAPLLITSLFICFMVILTTPSVPSPCSHFLLKYCFLSTLFINFLCFNFIQVLFPWTELNFL